MAALLGPQRLVLTPCSVLSADKQQCRHVQPARLRPRPQLHSSRHSLSHRSLLCGARRPDSPILEPLVHGGGHPNDFTDLQSWMLRNRIVFTGTRIDEQMATQTVASLLALEAIDPVSDIKVYINAPNGGSVYPIMAILDTINAIQPEVATIAIGSCSANAIALLAGGSPGKRYAMKNTRFLMHHPIGIIGGGIRDVERQIYELQVSMEALFTIISNGSGQPHWRIEELHDRPTWRDSDWALDFGLIDGVLADDNP